MEFLIPLNKFEKRDLVIKLHNEGKTYSEIAHIAHVSLRDIKPILKEYEKRKKRLESKKREENNQNGQIKKPSISTQAFKLFRDGKRLTDVAIDLEIPARKVVRLWLQFLRLERMDECFEFYQIFQSQIPDFLAIGSFIRNNEVDTRNIANILKEAKDVYHLQSYHSQIQNEIERLQKFKNNYVLNQNTNNYQPLLPLGLPKYYYEQLL